MRPEESLVKPSPVLGYQGLEDILQRLEDHLEDFYTGTSLYTAMPEVCIRCWSLLSEDTCTCAYPTFWPLSHGIGRLRAQLGYEG